MTAGDAILRVPGAPLPRLQDGRLHVSPAQALELTDRLQARAMVRRDGRPDFHGDVVPVLLELGLPEPQVAAMPHGGVDLVVER